ncbi:MAG TPA: hypothetical protein VFL81_01130, partial [Candidatus Saccharimonadales bacterium]|nr:hypothetical protein [Candidatus Saccharimonadales bacterium]
GDGKSSTMKILASRLMLTAAGYHMMRIAINDYKPEGDAGEYEKLSRAYRSKVFHINEMRVNVFDPRLFIQHDGSTNTLAVLEIAHILCETFLPAGTNRLIGNDGVALRAAVHAMMTMDKSLWSPHSLLYKLLTLSGDDINGYFGNLDSKIKCQLETKHERLSATLQKTTRRQLDDLYRQQNNASLEDIKKSAVYVASLLDGVINGPYGYMFGDDHSLYDVMTQRAVTKDWRNVPPDGETLMRTIDARIKLAAIEGNRLDLLPHLELDDEKHKSMGNLVYATQHSHLSEIGRGVHTCNLSASHYLHSIRRGAVGSELYNLGETIIDNLGFIMIGSQPNKKNVLGELQDRYDLSDADTRQLTRMPKYHFGIKLGQETPMIFGRVFATPSELPLLPTDAAANRMQDKPDINDADDLRRFAKENGIRYLGLDHEAVQ